MLTIMPLGPSAVRELDAELQSLERKRQDIDERIAAIQLVLKRTPAAKRGQSVPPRGVAQLNDGGLRAALRKLLSKGPMAPGQVIKALIEGGYEAPGKTPLPVRVYNELGRMRRDGQVRDRDSEGRYALAS
jgi:hypothetical protein